jgi:outer membrane lipoprotein-sorting protein
MAKCMMNRLGACLFMAASLVYAGCGRSSKEPLPAQPLMTADEVFEFRAAKTAEYHSYSAIVMHAQRTRSGVATWQEKRWWQAPNLSRYEIGAVGGGTGPTALQVTDSNSVSWTESTGRLKKSVVKTVPDRNHPSYRVYTQRMEMNPLLACTGYRWFKDDIEYAVLSPGKIDGQRMYVLESVPQPASPSFRPQIPDDPGRKTRLYIGERDGFIHRIEIFSEKMAGLHKYDPKEPYERTDWKELKLNVEFPGTLFVYEPPPGVTVTERAFNENTPVSEPVVDLPPINPDWGPLATAAFSLDDKTRWDAQQKLYMTKDKGVVPILIRSLDVEGKRTEAKLTKVEQSGMLGRGIHLPTMRVISYLKELGGKDVLPYLTRFKTMYPRYIYEVDQTIFELEHDTSKPVNTDLLQLFIHAEISGTEAGRVTLSYKISSTQTNGPAFYAYAYQVLVDGRIVYNSGTPYAWPRVVTGKMHRIPLKASSDGLHTATLRIADTDRFSSTRFHVPPS